MTTVDIFIVITGCANVGLLFTAIITVLIALRAYINDKKNSTNELVQTRNRIRIDKACELAKFFADNIIWKTNIISQVCAMQNINCLTKRSTLKFTWSEAEDIIKADNLFTDIIDKKVFAKSLNINYDYILRMIEINKRLNTIFTSPSYIDLCYTDKNDSMRHYVGKRLPTKAVISQQTRIMLSQFLNELEWFCMNFNCEIADETVVYQSLHQAFISTVQILYFSIAIQNDGSSSDRYFINIADLYNKWKTREDINKKIIYQAEDNSIVRGNKY